MVLRAGVDAVVVDADVAVTVGGVLGLAARVDAVAGGAPGAIPCATSDDAAAGGAAAGAGGGGAVAGVAAAVLCCHCCRC